MTKAALRGLRCKYCGKTHKPTELHKCTACDAVVCKDSLTLGTDEYGIEIRWHERFHDGQLINCGPCFRFDPTDPEVFELEQKFVAGKKKLAVREMVERQEQEERERDEVLRKTAPMPSPPPRDAYTKQWPAVGKPEPGERWGAPTTAPTTGHFPQERRAKRLEKAFPDPPVPEEVQKQWMEIVRKAGLCDD